MAVVVVVVVAVVVAVAMVAAAAMVVVAMVVAMVSWLVSSAALEACAFLQRTTALYALHCSKPEPAWLLMRHAPVQR
jgi:hypothetical protein